ncbi:MAG TPA: EamA family transporter RarD [Steroidobacteraceae bacterium]|nr:EamA family transporter RarD [Steroidobacteraceae bacterium]
MSAPQRAGRGLACGAAGFTIWGLFPLYLHALRTVPAPQVIGHRIVWSCAFILAWMLARGELRGLAAIFTQPPLLARLLLSALLISTNWLVYVWGVDHGHIVEGSLGYYINPLINVVLGIFVLRERLNPVQWTAVALAALAVAYLTYEAGRPPWIALTLAFSFSLYGLVRKVISVEALPGLATETVLLLPAAAAYLLWCAASGSGAFAHAGASTTALLLGLGPVTAVPLFLFAYAARRLRYSTVGILQYIGPSLQLGIGVLIYHEAFDGARAVGFVLIWLALAIYAADGVWRSRAPATLVRVSGG